MWDSRSLALRVAAKGESGQVAHQVLGGEVGLVDLELAAVESSELLHQVVAGARVEAVGAQAELEQELALGQGDPVADAPQRARVGARGGARGGGQAAGRRGRP